MKYLIWNLRRKFSLMLFSEHQITIVLGNGENINDTVVFPRINPEKEIIMIEKNTMKIITKDEYYNI